MRRCSRMTQSVYLDISARKVLSLFFNYFEMFIVFCSVAARTENSALLAIGQKSRMSSLIIGCFE